MSLDIKETAKEPSRNTLWVAAPLIMNWFSCVSVVLANKYVTKNWPFGYTLTCIHFFTTFLVLLLLCSVKFFQYKKLEVVKVAPLSFLFCASIVLNNLSIQYNSV